MRLSGMEQLRREVGELRQLTLKANSLSEYSLIDMSAVKTSPVYKRCAEIITLLSPMDVDEGSYVPMFVWVRSSMGDM